MQTATNGLSPEIFRAVIDLAREAGRAILAFYQAPQAALIDHKADETPLTQADLAAHQTIFRGLQALTPLIPVVSEEDESSLVFRTAAGLYWLVDPLDGTKEFLARNGEFTVNIALVSDGEARWGVVVAPAIGAAYWGGRGSGAFADYGQGPVALPVPPAEGNGPLRVVASKSHLNAETRRFIDALGPHELVQAGSSLKFCRLAEGQADLYPRLSPTSEWDTAAAQAVLEAAGGRVLQLDGQPLGYGKADLINPSFVALAPHDAGHWAPC
ncbi:MAG: 3'(2'),5'-bisphosphate nucleotidase CysQ [Betaproteobacteria bacterium]|nr:3'(2'),5'-bisphosphate nucleotidase CysQ [Betaproteobacteria bacterium]